MPDSRIPRITEQRIAAVRRFNRFYTRHLGTLREGLHGSAFSLTEARVLYEIANRPGVFAGPLARELGIDPGYLSRIVQRFSELGLVGRHVPDDRRQKALKLTAAGETAFAPLNTASQREISTMLGKLSGPGQAELVQAMGRIETLLKAESEVLWLLRQPEPGDIGWVIARHGALYAAEYDFDARFEALVAQVAGTFLKQHDPTRERCWIAERHGVNIGSVFLVQESDDVARLRLLLVEPTARGLGLGKQLVQECIGFARSAGYHRVTLWTNDVLLPARALYRAAGFKMTATQPHNNFGPSIVGEDWDLPLD